MSLKPLTLKEIKSLVRDRTFLASLIITPLILLSMGAVESHMVNKAVKEESLAIVKMKIAIAVEDKGDVAEKLALALKDKSNNIQLFEVKKVDPLRLFKEGFSAVLVIPEGFSENITSGKQGVIDVYLKGQGAGISMTARTQGLDSAVRIALGKALSETLGIPETLFLSPLRIRSFVFIPSLGVLNSREASSLMWLPLSIGMILLVLAIVVAQLSALSMSFEREEKTLELLLSLPISRSSIIFSKISGAFLVSLIEVVVFSASIIGYLKLIASSGGVEIGPALKILESPKTLTLLSGSMVVVLFFISALAMLLGMFGKDPRTSQSISTSVVAPLALIGYFITLGGIPGGSAGFVVASLPITPVVISILAPLQGKTFLALYSIGVNTVYMIISIYALAKVASGERLLIGFRVERRSGLSVLKKLRG